MKTEQVILVDEFDQPSGVAGKLEAHEKGLLHRAFSIFIFNTKGEMLLQRRAKNKYHSSGLWSNACCSHPQPEQDTLTAAGQRLQ
jgi:isopentenyl-diphosphate delta-isomerase